MNNRPNRRLRPLLLVAETTESDYKLLEITLGKEYELLRADEGCTLAVGVQVGLHADIFFFC